MITCTSSTTTATLTLATYPEAFRWDKIHPWMNDPIHLVGELELRCYAVSGPVEEEFRPTIKRRLQDGWVSTSVSFYSRYERRQITKYLERYGPTAWVSRPYRSPDRYAIAHQVNEPELSIMFLHSSDRARFIDWANGRFPRPVLFVTKNEISPEVKRLLKGVNHHVVIGSNRTLISTEVMPSEKMRTIQALLEGQ